VLLYEGVLRRSALLRLLSHDLRNPLNAVLLGTHLLRAHELSANDARVVARIASSAERATQLVADLLDFTQARLGGGTRESLRQNFRLLRTWRFERVLDRAQIE
jgi:phosphoserine phosphatase RsbU/P